MNRIVSRFVYRVMVQLHPKWFKDRFGDEMMWIFEEESRGGGSVRLLADGLRSLVRQRCRVVDRATEGSVLSGMVIVDSGLGAGRFLQGAAMAFVLFGGFAVLLGQRVPGEVHVRRPEWLVCTTVRLQAPAWGEVRAKVARQSAGVSPNSQ